jgi:soluble lytic murein transglycosylase
MADLLARTGNEAEALTLYETFLEEHPTDESAPHVAWQIGAVREQLGDMAGAQEAYAAMAEGYPEHEDAPRALLRAGWLAYDNDAVDQARNYWQQLVERYPTSSTAEEAFVWLLRATPAAEAEPLAQQVISHTLPSGYFALRARELVRGEAPFTPPAGYQFEFDDQQAREEAEAWLSGWLPGVSVTSTLTTAVTQDSRFVRGEKLWEIGLREEARQEFESLRADYAFDALTSYQLALYFRDLGAYRSSIGAAASVLALSGQTVFEAPPLIGRLLYPAYYAELILPLAEQYGYDPLLQFALVRQESLFESFAESYVGATGLSQVMPATGADIAGRLNWPDYETDDLTRPVVGLAFGAYYIATQLDYFDGYAHAALSAYNAGPGNAARWYEVAGGDLDLYLRTVDFAETRLYIQRIFEGYQYYRFLYGLEESDLR